MSNESISKSRRSTEPQRYRVKRDGAADLIFTGVLLGEGETAVQVVDKLKNAYVERGHTCRLYRSEPPSNRFVVEFIAWSQIANERDRCDAFSCGFTELEYLKAKLLGLTSSGMPEAAKQALEAAAEHDERLWPVLLEDMDDPTQAAAARRSAESITASLIEPMERFKENLRLADAFKALDEYLEAIRAAKNACARVGGGFMGPNDSPENRVLAAHNALCIVEDTVDRLMRRLPIDLRPETERLSHEIRNLTARTGSALASRPPEAKWMMAEVVEFGKKLSDAYSHADSSRTELIR